MNSTFEDQPEKQSGLDIEEIGFDANGEITGIDDIALDAVSGGILGEATEPPPDHQWNCK